MNQLPSDLINLLGTHLCGRDFFTLYRCCRTIRAALRIQALERKVERVQSIMPSLVGHSRILFICPGCKQLVEPTLFMRKCECGCGILYCEDCMEFCGETHARLYEEHHKCDYACRSFR